MTEGTVPLAPGHASDLPGRVHGVTFTHAAPLLERLPDRLAGRALVLVAIGGLVAQLLFYGQQPGVNFPIWVAFVLGVAVAVRRPDATIDRPDIWLPVAAFVFAALCALVTDGMLLFFDVAAAGALTIAAIVALGGQPLTRHSWNSTIGYCVRAVGVYVFGAAHLANGVRALPRSHAERQTTSWRIVRGLVLAVPLVLLFVVLFAGADAVFSSLVAKALPVNLDGSDIIGRTLVALAAAWLLGGAVVCGWLTRERDIESSAEGAPPVSGARVGRVEAIVVLAAIDAIFLFFVALQATYLFGGVDTLQITGMTYSDYARRGFGELIAVAVVSGIVLVALGNLVHERGTTYRLLAGTLCIGTAVVVASAFMRITLYQQAYGWTELRFYTVAGICLLAFCAVVALVATALDRMRLLPLFALGAGWRLRSRAT